MKHEFICYQCGLNKIHESDFTTGYATDKEGNKVCFDCCGLNDAKELTELKPKEKFWLYLDTKKKQITNWPGTLVIPINYIREGNHNMAGKRYDTWFKFNGNSYHATQYGDNTQVAHIRKIAS